MATGVGLTLVVFLLSLWTANAQRSDNPSGILVVGGAQVNVDIPTRVGCPELIRCLGNGSMDSLQWRRFGLRRILQTENNRVITIMHDGDLDMDGTFSFVSHLEFNPIRLTDSGSFTCSVNSLGTHTARVRVAPDLVEIFPINHDLSIRTMGEMMTIPCTVESCVPNLTIQLLRDDVVHDTVQRQGVFGPQEDTFNLTANASIAGQYNCRVVGTFMGVTFVFDQSFNITGAPQPRPSPSTTLQRPDGSNNNVASRLHTSLSSMLLAALISLSHVAIL